MLDKTGKGGATATTQGAPTDFQQHLKTLEAQGLVVRVERPINKDTELHPLVRWQFAGGLPEDARRAFLFTNVVGRGRPQVRHAGGGRRACGLGAHLFPRHGQAGGGDRERRGRTPSPIPSRRCA